MAIESSAVPQSRRALLAGALGGLAAAAAVLGRPGAVSAAAGSTMIIGSEANNAGSANTQLLTNSSVVAFKLLQNGPGTALMGYATPATGATRGVYGRSDSPNGFGVQARNMGAFGAGAAVQALGGNNHGLDAITDGYDAYAVRAENTAGGIGLLGISEVGDAVVGETDTATGVVGNAIDGYGVWGTSWNSHGIHGSTLSETGHAGFFEGRVEITTHLDIDESADTTAPAANTGRLFMRDNGADKTQLCVKFPDGSTFVLATEGP